MFKIHAFKKNQALVAVVLGLNFAVPAYADYSNPNSTNVSRQNEVYQNGQKTHVNDQYKIRVEKQDQNMSEENKSRVQKDQNLANKIHDMINSDNYDGVV